MQHQFIGAHVNLLGIRLSYLLELLIPGDGNSSSSNLIKAQVRQFSLLVTLPGTVNSSSHLNIGQGNLQLRLYLVISLYIILMELLTPCITCVLIIRAYYTHW